VVGISKPLGCLGGTDGAIGDVVDRRLKTFGFDGGVVMMAGGMVSVRGGMVGTAGLAARRRRPIRVKESVKLTDTERLGVRGKAWPSDGTGMEDGVAVCAVWGRGGLGV
jgi:hypothetical protein